MLHYITRGCPPFTVEKNAKIPSSFFKTRNREGKKCTKDTSRKEEELDEDKLLIYRNDLVRGVVDKAQFGDYGMVHTVQELYGSNTAGNLLTALSRLFTTYLQVSTNSLILQVLYFVYTNYSSYRTPIYFVIQMHGFTCGVDDLLLIDGKDGERKNQLESCEEIGDIVHREFIGVMDGDSIGNLKQN